MKHIVILLIIIGHSWTLFGQYSQSKRLEKYVSKYVEMEIDLNKNPGILIGLIDGDSTYVYQFGEATKGNTQPPTDSSIFEIGSMTKIFTASLLQILVDEGKIDYQKTLADYLGKEKLHESIHDLTVWSLATHTSGFPRVPINFSIKDKDPNNPFAHYTDTDFDEFLLDYNLFQTGNYIYSHVNYALIERIIETVENKDFQEVLNKKMLQPLAFQNTTYELNIEQKSRLNSGYLLDGTLAPSAEFSTFYGSIGLLSDMNDLIRFVQLNLKIGETFPLQSSLVKTQVSQVNTGVKKYIDTGIGWHIIRPKRKYYEVVSHRGTGIGHQAYIAFVPETQTGVIILANSRNSLEGLGYFMLKMMNNNWKRK
ncbi:MAG: serine hydrolase domain-containing protein [Saprospiraceae bacterium]